MAGCRSVEWNGGGRQTGDILDGLDMRVEDRLGQGWAKMCSLGDLTPCYRDLQTVAKLLLRVDMGRIPCDRGGAQAVADGREW